MSTVHNKSTFYGLQLQYIVKKTPTPPMVDSFYKANSKKDKKAYLYYQYTSIKIKKCEFLNNKVINNL